MELRVPEFGKKVLNWLRCLAANVSRETLGGALPPLLADTEIAENHVEDVFDVDAACQSAKGCGGGTQLLSEQVFMAGEAQGAFEGGMGFD